MRMYRDSESIRRVSTEEPDKQLRELIARRILDLADYSDYELENLLNIITIEPSDAIADLGFLLGDRLPELVEYHTAWVELTYIISDDGFGWVVYVPVDRACPRFCVNGLMAGNCLHLQRKRNDRKQRTDRPPVGGLQKT